jgi:hypothetical protein
VTVAEIGRGRTETLEGRGREGLGASSVCADGSSRAAAVQLIWRDPPPDRCRRVLTAEIVAQLRANPGRWAVIRQCPNRTAVKGVVAKHPADIELRGVEEPPGSVLYARAYPKVTGGYGDGPRVEEHCQ